MKYHCENCEDLIVESNTPHKKSPYNGKPLCLTCASEIKKEQEDFLRYYPDEQLDFWNNGEDT